jgi:hypothetical protein
VTTTASSVSSPSGASNVPSTTASSVSSPNASVGTPNSSTPSASSVSSPSSSSNPSTSASSVVPPVSSKPSGSSTVKPLGWWEDFLVWWAEQTEKAKSLQDEEAKRERDAARATGEVGQMAAEAYIANLDAVAKANGCTSISSCNAPEMQRLREIWNNTKDLPPAERLEMQQRIGLNVFRFAVDDNSSCTGCRQGLTSVLNNLSKSTANGKKLGYRTAEEMWGNSRGFALTDDQRFTMSVMQQQIHQGKKTAAQIRQELRGNDFWNSVGRGWEKFAAWLLGDIPSELLQQVALAGGIVGVLALGTLLAGLSEGVIAIVTPIIAALLKDAAIYGLIANVGIGAFFGVLGQIAVNAYRQVQCGSNVGLFDNLAPAAVGGGISGLGAGLNPATTKAISSALSGAGANALKGLISGIGSTAKQLGLRSTASGILGGAVGNGFGFGCN